MNNTNLRLTIHKAVRLNFAASHKDLRNATTGLTFFLFTFCSLAQDVIYNNGNILIGNGAENSINAKGNLQQPFYHNGANWVKLTYSNIALNASYAIGGNGANEWNINGELKNDPMITGHLLDLYAFSEGSGTIISSGTISFSGTNLLVETTYDLLPEVNFMKISVKLTNPGTVTIPNVRMWIGTRDDYVGITDNPFKVRGNLVDGQFEPLTDASKRGAAIRVTSGQEGVLLFADSDHAHSILQNCCNWNNVINQNPLTAGISSGSDGSYGLYFRFADLGPGESGELTWYYAAGANDEFEEIIQNVAQAARPISDITCTSATFKASTQMSGTGHYIVVSKSAAAPTAQQIKVAENYADVSVLASGNAVITSGNSHNFHIENLESASDYAVYYTLESQPNIFSAIKHYFFGTLTPLEIDLEPLATSFCGHDGNGSVISHITGGTAPYSYLWSSGDTTQHISGKPAGEYAVLINDASGCPAGTATTYIEVDDSNPPVAIVQSVILYYDSTGTAILNPSQIDGGSYDDCGIDTMEISHNTFQCNSQGDTYHTVILSVFDLNGNMDEAVALVQVYDTIRPHSLAQNLVIYTDANGTAYASVESVDIGSTDNCIIAGKQLSKSIFNCTDLGENTVNYKVTDGNGNYSSVDIILTVLDTIKPVALVQNLVIDLDENGQATASASMVDTGSSDNCEIAKMRLSKTIFDCSDLGENIIWFTVIDISDNETSTPININVIDRILPVIESPDEITVCAGIFDLRISATANDNCVSTIQQLSGPLWGDELVTGDYEVKFQATDLSGNTIVKSTFIHVVALPETTLETSYEVHPGVSFQITAGNLPNQRYQWSMGDTTASVSLQIWEETTIWVQVENEAGCGEYHEILLEIRNPYEPSDPSRKGAFLLYPNPATSNMNIRFYLPEKMEKGEMHISDAQGRILKKQPLEKIVDNDVVAIDIGHLTQGMYHITLTSNNLNFSTPFIKY